MSSQISTVPAALTLLDDRWDDAIASRLDAPELLRYRSNLLGSDLRLTNFGGGNTSSKLEQTDPLTGHPVPVLWVKGSGGDLGSISRGGFATLYMEKLLAVEALYKGVDAEDAVVDLYPLCTFENNPVAASIDTPLHGFLPFPHIDHLHPDWGIALAAAANGKTKMEEFNRRFNHHLVWLPWQRPGFELAMMLRSAVEANPGCDAIILGGHGIFTWGMTQRECYLNTITLVDELGRFINEHKDRKGTSSFGGQLCASRSDRHDMALSLFPFIRGGVSTTRRMIGTYSDARDVLDFVNSKDAEKLAFLGTSCPDHFIRTKIRPMYIPLEPDAGPMTFKQSFDAALKKYRSEYEQYYRAHALKDSPAMRDTSPTVVLVPGVGMFSFGKNKAESRITGEFYTNAIHVMEGASALGEGGTDDEVPQCGSRASQSSFTVHTNYVALPLSEAFRIEYWKLEEAKIRRQPPEKELSRQVMLVVGGGSGIGREVVRIAAGRGAHIMVADRDVAGAEQTMRNSLAAAGKEAVHSTAIDVSSREAVRSALQATISQYGGIDILVNTAAMFPSSPDGIIRDEQWASTLAVNVTANYILADEAAKLWKEQGLAAALVLTSSANAVVAKKGSEAYDVSKAALSHLVRELSVSLAPLVRVNGVSPATVVKGSTMFPRDRVIASLRKYEIAFTEEAGDDELRNLLAGYYAKRTLTHIPIDPADCANAILFLAGPLAPCTTGHLIPVDGGLVEAFLR